MRTFLALSLLPLTFAAAGVVTPAQTPVPAAEPSPVLVEHVEGIHRSLDRISKLLERVLEHEQTSLLMARIDLKDRRLSTLERELRGVEAEREGAEAERTRIEAMADEMERQAQGEGGEPSEVEAVKVELRLLRQQLETVERREATLHQAWIDLEAQIATARADLRTLEERLDARLNMR